MVCSVERNKRRRQDVDLPMMHSMVLYLSPTGECLSHLATDDGNPSTWISTSHTIADHIPFKTSHDLSCFLATLLRLSTHAIPSITSTDQKEAKQVDAPKRDSDICFIPCTNRLLEAYLTVHAPNVILCVLHTVDKGLMTPPLESPSIEPVALPFLTHPSLATDLRTHLNGLLGMLQLLKDTDLSAEQKEYVDCVEGCGEGVLRVVEGLETQSARLWSHHAFGQLALEDHK
ncbi:hypothetical protein BZG36_04372 [Bifiguratus adelaidae]|uniref:Signal transduction histidine kinase dimerisation/phosphoacceptor domain-containing protein n=1 Tax=Bifiguratus adelaidae TaxID=1938954 RepID=A0A261XVW8_9FUNG|nr:hypothetical protein BZG36_04372 [Bifiguratus adelaidae]